MSEQNIVRAWKDPAYRASLTPEQLAAMPKNPAGMVEISSAELNHVAGGRGGGVSSLPCELDKLGFTKNTFPCCPTQDITCDNRTVGGKIAI